MGRARHTSRDDNFAIPPPEFEAMSLRGYGWPKLSVGGKVDVSLEVIISVTEHMVDHDKAFGVMADRIFPCHRHTPVQLNDFLGDKAIDAADQVFCCRHIQLTHVAVVIQSADGEQNAGAGLLNLERHIHNSMLQRLERAESAAELL